MSSADELRARASRFAAARPAPAAANAPDPGQVLATAVRPDGSELRVSLHHYEGKPFLRIAPWQRGSDGAWWPVKGKGVSVKVRELGAVAEGLAGAMDALDRERGPGGG